ncbi:IS256-like element ISCth4 family transposase [Acetivibrio thermocellus]|uniref:Mutator family transposase n=1 Tax=Acetivibrio thermocellus (strain ATCC 27405 / DSM 1237 / JCM 9322 / NBRC 103400 / NCIMB 10682 / NRRL B-4536 / VPI 7372) TaxID=203119 RepID=A3DE24_ACET2|nr:IS256-like element ISCth4 family transposase [Acetivibrio thermocellus]ABN52203.1 transposase mutator type [Acetivibrio thermocellus ATCC 27405]ABN54402.1 transposase mutator type [Acetivibrio thermocellus ATCC 27405]
MARKRIITPEKKELIRNLISEYNITSAKDLQEALKDLLGDTIQNMLEAELDEHLGYEKYESTEEAKSNYRNGYTSKTLKSSVGQVEIDIPRDRNAEFEPKIVPRYKRDISEIENKIIAMYARGMSTREINEQIQEIYGFEVSAEMVSKITDKILPQIEEWQKRPLGEVYPIVFIDAIHFSVKNDGIVGKKAVYIVLAIDIEGQKDVIGIYVGENESSKFWLSVLNDLKNRGVKDILILCADALSGIKDAINAAFPNTEYQRCIVHQIRNTLKYVSDKDRKEFARDLKRIYTAPNEKAGYDQMLEVSEKWEKKYPAAMKSWKSNWDVICPFFKYSEELRKIMYTTNTIESLNSSYRRINKSRTVFPGDQSLLKSIYLATVKITSKWTMRYKNWGLILGQLQIMFEGRI